MSITPSHIALLIVYSVGMIGGQMLFKAASIRHNGGAGTIYTKILNLSTDPFFIVSLALYLLLSVFWVWILTIIPISKAYPFVALSFIGTSIGGWLFFSERLSTVNFIGLIVLGAGIIMATR